MVKLNKTITIVAVMLFSLMMMGITAAATMGESNTISTNTATTSSDSVVDTLESYGLNHVASEVVFSTQRSDCDEIRICPSCGSRSVIRICGKEHPYYCYKCHYNFGSPSAHK